LSVPGGMSNPDLPERVTVPGFVGCLNCLLRYLPFSHQFAPRHHLYFAADVDHYLVSISLGLQVQE
jgi:hypothetical protein